MPPSTHDTNLKKERVQNKNISNIKYLGLGQRSAAQARVALLVLNEEGFGGFVEVQVPGHSRESAAVLQLTISVEAHGLAFVHDAKATTGSRLDEKALIFVGHVTFAVRGLAIFRVLEALC